MSAKSVASFSGDRVDTNRKFVGQGLAKIAVAFFSGIPVSGSLTRSALMYQAGAVSKAAHVFSSVLLAAMLFALGPVASSYAGGSFSAAQAAKLSRLRNPAQPRSLSAISGESSPARSRMVNVSRFASGVGRALSEIQ